MQHVLIRLIYLIFALCVQQVTALADCQCPQVTCGSCQEESGLDFYTQKCEGALISCTRPVCVSARFPTPQCLSAKSDSTLRMPASITTSKSQPGQVVAFVGKVKQVKGKAFRLTPAGEKHPLKAKAPIFSGDTLYTESASRLVVHFNDRNKMVFSEQSRLMVTSYVPVLKTNPYGQVSMELLNGSVRHQVGEAYLDNAQSHYWVLTKNAVVRVHGTDFEVTYKQGKDYDTEVKTYKGEVELSSPQGNVTQLVKANERRSYVVTSKGVFSESDLVAMMEKGHMTPVYKLSGAEVAKRKAKISTRLPQKVGSTVNQSVVCVQPKADFNECVWSCLNNPDGEQACRTDLPQVTCVRARCNANGEWVEATRLPASHFDRCPSAGIKVSRCDY